jgi:hypothetical protein
MDLTESMISNNSHQCADSHIFSRHSPSFPVVYWMPSLICPKPVICEYSKSNSGTFQRCHLKWYSFPVLFNHPKTNGLGTFLPFLPPSPHIPNSVTIPYNCPSQIFPESISSFILFPFCPNTGVHDFLPGPLQKGNTLF